MSVHVDISRSRKYFTASLCRDYLLRYCDFNPNVGYVKVVEDADILR